VTLTELDHRITARITRPHPIWRIFSRMGDGWLYAIAFLWLRYSGHRMESNQVASSILCAWGLGSMLKWLIRRPRQNPVRASILRRGFMAKIASWTFPSQHAAVAVAFAFVLWPSPLPVVLAGAICASRVLIGAHYLGDVLAGIAVGLLAGRLA
jgi:undecaprenyl-diphosphatase